MSDVNKELQAKIDNHVQEPDGNCLNCGNISIEGKGVEIEGKYAVQEVSCNYCGSSWKDVYNLADTQIIGISNDHKNEDTNDV